MTFWLWSLFAVAALAPTLTCLALEVRERREQDDLVSRYDEGSK